VWPLICNYKLHSIKHVCHTDFSARTEWKGEREREGKYICESVCRRETGNQFALWLQLLIFDTSKDFINCHLLSALKKKVLRCFSDFGNLFWPFPLATPHSHTHTHSHSHQHPNTIAHSHGHMCFLFSSWLRLPCTTLINSMCDSCGQKGRQSKKPGLESSFCVAKRSQRLKWFFVWPAGKLGFGWMEKLMRGHRIGWARQGG